MNSQWIDASDPRVAVSLRRLETAARSHDLKQIRKTMRQLTDRHGAEIVGEAWALLLCQDEFAWIQEQMFSAIPESDRQNIYGAGLEVLADVLSDAGLRLEHHLRVSDSGVALSKDAIAALAATGYPDIEKFGKGNTPEDLASFGLGRSPFFHPLSEFFPAGTHIDGESMNLWACASVVISGAMGWFPEERATPQAKEAIADLLSVAAPTLDQARLIRQSRYDDRALLKLCSYVERALQGQCDRAFEK